MIDTQILPSKMVIDDLETSKEKYRNYETPH